MNHYENESNQRVRRARVQTKKIKQKKPKDNKSVCALLSQRKIDGPLSVLHYYDITSQFYVCLHDGFIFYF